MQEKFGIVEKAIIAFIFNSQYNELEYTNKLLKKLNENADDLIYWLIENYDRSDLADIFMGNFNILDILGKYLIYIMVEENDVVTDYITDKANHHLDTGMNVIGIDCDLGNSHHFKEILLENIKGNTTGITNNAELLKLYIDENDINYHDTVFKYILSKMNLNI